jgi:hypothetical protein
MLQCCINLRGYVRSNEIYMLILKDELVGANLWYILSQCFGTFLVRMGKIMKNLRQERKGLCQLCLTILLTNSLEQILTLSANSCSDN